MALTDSVSDFVNQVENLYCEVRKFFLLAGALSRLTQGLSRTLGNLLLRFLGGKAGASPLDYPEADWNSDWRILIFGARNKFFKILKCSAPYVPAGYFKPILSSTKIKYS